MSVLSETPDTAQAPTPRAADSVAPVLAHLSLDERASLTAGQDTWHLPAVPSVGIGRLKMSDGPSGVRGESFAIQRSLAYPCGIAVGATWDVDLAHRYGVALAAEAALKGVRVLLGPTICIPRVPVAGRTFESFSEDPLLTARLAVAYIRGVQENGVAACVKHFACNDQEWERMTISAEVSERALREIHLAPFEAAVREAGVRAVMSAYNRLNGTFCSENAWLLTTVLRHEWGFDGVVVSDWHGTHSTVEAATAGLDIEMPGPALHLGAHLAAAVRAGTVPESVLDEHCERILRLVTTTEKPDAGGEREEDDPGRRSLARELAVGGTVLLRNRGVLPLEAGVRRVAIIGPFAARLTEGGGGSSMVAPLRATPFPEALAARLPGTEIAYAEGCRLDFAARPLDGHLMPDGMEVEYFDNAEWRGDPLRRERRWSGFFVTFGAPPGERGDSAFSVRTRCRFVPDSPGTWELSLATVGAATVHLDGQLVLDHTKPEPGETFFGYGSTVATATVEVEQGRVHDLEVRYLSDRPGLGGFRIGARPAQVVGDIDAAVELARTSDVAIVVVGNHPDLETEGHDRPTMHLPGAQDELVRRVAAANPRTVVVVNAGSPVAMPWAEDAGAVLTAWYPGEEGADALADIVAGVTEPGGRLPITLPKRLEDVAAFATYPGADGRVPYDEGLLVGYRQFDTDGTEPAYCFGHGLGYTTFDLGAPRATLDTGGAVTLALTVTNTGARRGSEVIQVYVGDAPNEARPAQTLAAFAKVTLDPGEARAVHLRLDARALASWDDDTHGWAAPAGRYSLRIGVSSRDIRHQVHIDHPGASLPVGGA